MRASQTTSWRAMHKSNRTRTWTWIASTQMLMGTLRIRTNLKSAKQVIKRCWTRSTPIKRFRRRCTTSTRVTQIRWTVRLCRQKQVRKRDVHPRRRSKISLYMKVLAQRTCSSSAKTQSKRGNSRRCASPISSTPVSWAAQPSVALSPSYSVLILVTFASRLLSLSEAIVLMSPFKPWSTSEST